MPSVNKVILIGNVTRNPELRYTPKQTAVAEFGLAMNRKFRVDNDLREEVTFVDVTFWGQQAETISKYVEKGSPLYVEGRLKLDTWDDKDTGKKRSKITVIGERFQFLGGRGSGGGPMEDSGGSDSRQSYGSPSAAIPAAASPPPATGSGPMGEEEEEGDDIPF